MKSLFRFVAPAAVLCAASAASADLTLNLQASFDPIKAKLAAGQQANIVVLGDSLSFRPGTYLPYFTDHMQSYYGNAGAGWQGYGYWTDGALDPGWTVGTTGQDVAPHLSLDGLWASTQAATTGWLAPQDNQITLQYVAQPGGGSFRPFYWSGNGKTYLSDPLSCSSSTAEIRTWTYNVPAGSGAVWYQTDGAGTVTILGQNNITSNSGVRVHRAANGGWGVNNFLQRDWTFDSQLQNLGTDMVMVWLGQNDQGYDRTTYAAKIRQLDARIHADVPNAKIVLIGTYDQGSPNLSGLVSAMNDVAAQDGVGFINVYQGAGNHQFFQDHGFIDPDGVHLSPGGGQYLGNFLYSAFRDNGKNVGALAGDCNFDGVVDVTDLGILAMNWQGGGIWSQGDFNYDGVVDANDLAVLASHWQDGSVQFQVAAQEAGLGNVIVPEPVTALLSSCLLGSTLMMSRRNRRTR